MSNPDVGEQWLKAERSAKTVARWRLAANLAVMFCAGSLYLVALAALGS